VNPWRHDLRTATLLGVLGSLLLTVGISRSSRSRSTISRARRGARRRFRAPPRRARRGSGLERAKRIASTLVALLV